jgi:YesN/AraC family two-component response regulator
VTGSALLKLSPTNLPFYACLKNAEVFVLKKLFEILEYRINQPKNDDTFIKNSIEYCLHALLEEVYSLLTKGAQVKKVQLSRKEAITARFIELLNIYFKTQRQLSFYADKLNITPPYLSQVIKEVSGKTAGEMIDEVVVIEAKRLLKDPQYNITEVSDQLNFTSASFFGKFFKKHTGKSPSKYRCISV